MFNSRTIAAFSELSGGCRRSKGRGNSCRVDVLRTVSEEVLNGGLLGFSSLYVAQRDGSSKTSTRTCTHGTADSFIGLGTAADSQDKSRSHGPQYGNEYALPTGNIDRRFSAIGAGLTLALASREWRTTRRTRAGQRPAIANPPLRVSLDQIRAASGGSPHDDATQSIQSGPKFL